MEKLKTSRFTSFDISLVAALFAIGLLGLLTLYSAMQGSAPEGGMPPHQKQLIWWGLGLMGILIVILIDYRHMEHYAYAIYAFSLLLLVYVLVMGRSISGAKRWIELGPLSFQPSEFLIFYENTLTRSMPFLCCCSYTSCSWVAPSPGRNAGSNSDRSRSSRPS